MISKEEKEDFLMCPVSERSAKSYLCSCLESNVAPDEISLLRVEDHTKSSLFVRHPDMNGGVEVNALASRRFSSWFNLNARNSIGAKQALSYINDLSEFDHTIPSTRLFLRVGYNSEKVYLNLCNTKHEVVEIGADGWKIIPEEQAPVLFVRNGNMKPLVTPMPFEKFRKDKGNIRRGFEKLRALVNTNDEDFFCVVGWLVAALNPLVECPILWMSAGKGRGKTTLTNWLKGLIDPDSTGALAPFEKEKDFHVAAASRYIIALDNLSRLTEKWSNIFCRAVTGEGVVQRKLYTDSTAFNMRLRVPMIVNGIDFKPDRSDLQDRCYPITLEKLNASSRRGKHELEVLFEEDRSLILSALINAVHSALGNTNYQPKSKVDVRMLDASLFVMKAAKANALPFTDDDFSKILMAKKAELEASEKSQFFDDSLASIIYDMALEAYKSSDDKSTQRIKVWEGHTSKLFELVTEKAKHMVTGTLKDIPSSPKSFGHRLSELKSVLEENGISISRSRTSQYRSTTILFDVSEGS